MWNQKRPMFTRDSVFGTFQLRYASRGGDFVARAADAQRPLQRARHFKSTWPSPENLTAS